jgi:hypothetical protein
VDSGEICEDVKWIVLYEDKIQRQVFVMLVTDWSGINNCGEFLVYQDGKAMYRE